MSIGAVEYFLVIKKQNQNSHVVRYWVSMGHFGENLMASLTAPKVNKGMAFKGLVKPGGSKHSYLELQHGGAKQETAIASKKRPGDGSGPGWGRWVPTRPCAAWTRWVRAQPEAPEQGSVL